MTAMFHESEDGKFLLLHNYQVPTISPEKPTSKNPGFCVRAQLQDSHYSPVVLCGVSTGFDSLEPLSLRKIVNTTIEPTARNSLCQF